MRRLTLLLFLSGCFAANPDYAPDSAKEESDLATIYDRSDLLPTFDMGGEDLSMVDFANRPHDLSAHDLIVTDLTPIPDMSCLPLRAMCVRSVDCCSGNCVLRFGKTECQ